MFLIVGDAVETRWVCYCANFKSLFFIEEANIKKTAPANNLAAVGMEMPAPGRMSDQEMPFAGGMGRVSVNPIAFL